MTAARFGRSVFTPETLSVHPREQPADFSASSCTLPNGAVKPRCAFGRISMSAGPRSVRVGCRDFVA